MDPADVSDYLSRSNIFSAFDASFSQALFSFSDVNKYTTAHELIYVKNNCMFSKKSEDVVLALHQAVCQRKVVAIASEKGNGSLSRYSQTNPTPKPKETLIGVYSLNYANAIGIYYKLSLSCNKLKMLKK